MSWIDCYEPIADQLDWDEQDQKEQEALDEAFQQITSYNHERRHLHDADGYFAAYAGSEKCEALGHRYEDEAQLTEAGVHGPSWNNEPLCVPTRYGVACTYCEGDCDHPDTAPLLWDLVNVENVTYARRVA